MKLTEEKIASEKIYQGHILNVRKDRVKLPNGKESSREVVEHPGAISVVAVDNDENIYLVKQFRYPVGEITLEIPAGKLDYGEDPLTCARRELSEEVGMLASEWKMLLKFFTTPGFSNEIMYLFLATGLSSHYEEADEDEFLEIVKMPLKVAVEEVEKGNIKDAKSIIGILYTAQKLKV